MAEVERGLVILRLTDAEAQALLGEILYADNLLVMEVRSALRKAGVKARASV